MSGSRNQAKVPAERNPKSICRQASLFAVSQCLGFKATLTTLTGRKFEGKLYSMTPDGIILRDVWESTHQNAHTKGLEKFMIFNRGEIVSCDVLDVAEPPKIINKNKKSEFQTDTEISNRDPSGMKALQAWVADDDMAPLENEGLDDVHNARDWDQFETNEKKFGIATTYDENFYTTTLNEHDLTDEAIRNADKIAAEIMNKRSGNIHLDEERGIRLQTDDDEEKRFSEVHRDLGRKPRDDSRGKKKKPGKQKKTRDENEGFASWGRNRVEHTEPKTETKKVTQSSTTKITENEETTTSDNANENIITVGGTKSSDEIEAQNGAAEIAVVTENGEANSGNTEEVTACQEETVIETEEKPVVDNDEKVSEEVENSVSTSQEVKTTEAVIEEETDQTVVEKEEEEVQTVEPTVEVRDVTFNFDWVKFENKNKNISQIEGDELNHRFSLKKISQQEATTNCIQTLTESYKPSLARDKRTTHWPMAERKERNPNSRKAGGFQNSNHAVAGGGQFYQGVNPMMVQGWNQGMVQNFQYGYTQVPEYYGQQQYYYPQQMYGMQMYNQGYGNYPNQGNPGRGDPNNYRGPNQMNGWSKSFEDSFQ